MLDEVARAAKAKRIGSGPYVQTHVQDTVLL